MKKLIVTTACTLLLSLFGASALGAKQDSYNIKNELNKELNTETAEQQTEVTTKETAKALLAKAITKIPSEKDAKNKATKMIAKETKNDKKGTVTEQKKVAPAVKAAKVIPVMATKITPAAANGQKANNCINPASNTASNKTVLNSDTVKEIVYDSKQNCYTLNGKVIAYGNVDLSKCGSVEDILAKLKNSGFKVEIPSNCNNNNNSYNNNNNNSNNNNSNNNNSSNNNKNNNNKNNSTPVQPAKPTQAPADNKDTQDNSGLSSYANQVLQLVNQERAKAGLSALTTNSTLTAAANKRAQETKQSFSHTRPNGTSFSSVLKEYNISYRTAGENIAYGQRTPNEVVNGWMNSPGHRANILNADFNKIGIGVYESNGTIYWSQLFTN